MTTCANWCACRYGPAPRVFLTASRPHQTWPSDRLFSSPSAEGALVREAAGARKSTAPVLEAPSKEVMTREAKHASRAK